MSIYPPTPNAEREGRTERARAQAACIMKFVADLSSIDPLDENRDILDRAASRARRLSETVRMTASMSRR